MFNFFRHQPPSQHLQTKRLGAASLLSTSLLAGVGLMACAQQTARQTPLKAPTANPPQAAPAVAATLPRRPNIVIIMADDMGYSDIGCYGGDIKTPHIDALAQGGLRFTNFHNTGRCCPTRASLLTGLYPHQAGIGDMVDDLGVDGYRGELNRHCLTMGEVLRGAGYATYMTGKWHVCRRADVNATTPEGKHDWPLQRGFDHYYGIIAGAANYFHPNSLTRDNERLPEPGDNYYTTDGFTDAAVGDITTRDKTKPFFLYVAYNAPHWPLNAKPADIAKYKGKFDGGWDTLREARYQRMVKLGLVDPQWALSTHQRDWDKVPAAQKKTLIAKMETYAAMVDCMDQGVGRITNALKKSGDYDNTLVIFLSDNGACHEGAGYGKPWANLSNTPYRRYKHWTNEGGIATPLIAHWPAYIKAGGALRTQPGHVIDLMATCVDLAQAPYPKTRNGQEIYPLEGTSLVPAFANQPLPRTALYWEHEGNRAMLQGDWKLVATSQGQRHIGPWELYNMAQDRTEQHDLAAAQPQRLQEMAKRWEAWAERAHVKPYPQRPDPQEDAESGEETEIEEPIATPLIANQPLVIRCDVTLQGAAQDANGTILAQGGARQGYALYLKAGKPIFGVREDGKLYTAEATQTLPAGKVALEARLAQDGTMTLMVNGKVVAQGKAAGLIRAQPVDKLSVGRDVQAAVGDYTTPFPFNGKVENITINPDAPLPTVPEQGNDD